jgi:lipid II:glycine glycyltransferase (peptidoglycan interpeptide bridge formation enzyme)
MKLINKIKFLKIQEYWFVTNEEEIKQCLFTLSVYRDSRVDIKQRLCFQEKKWTLITDLTLSKDEIFKQFASNLRNEIRKVEKLENITVSFNDISQERFIAFYNSFAEAKKLPFLSERRLSKYNNNLLYISGMIDDEITNVQVYIVDNFSKIARLLYSVSTIHGLDDKLKRNQIGWINKALHWYAMEYLKEENFTIYDWGGYSNDKENKALVGIDKFKKSFGGKLIELYDYKSLFVYMLEKIKEKV